MAGRTECCSYEPSLEDLLDDEVMAPVLRSAGYDPQGFRDMMVETAKRIDDRRSDGWQSDDLRDDDRADRDRRRGDR